MRYDLLLTGGHVIDPASGVDGRRDVAFASGRVAAVDTGILDGQGRLKDVVQAARRRGIVFDVVTSRGRAGRASSGTSRRPCRSS
jgi:dihydroorotase